jgi:hypothetical protein
LMLASLPAFEARSRSGALNKFSIGEFDVYLKEIDGSQHHGSISLSLLSKLTRCSLLNRFAQPDKLICPLIWFHVTPTVKIVHRRGVDRAQNYLAPIKHPELNDHPIEVVTLVASLQPHCNARCGKVSIVARR